jgi:hypothetical protein
MNGIESPTEHARQLLAARPAYLTYDRIAREAGVGREWLGKLAGGLIHDAGAAKIARLTAYLETFHGPSRQASEENSLC